MILESGLTNKSLPKKIITIAHLIISNLVINQSKITSKNASIQNLYPRLKIKTTRKGSMANHPLRFIMGRLDGIGGTGQFRGKLVGLTPETEIRFNGNRNPGLKTDFDIYSCVFVDISICLYICIFISLYIYIIYY